MRRWARAPLFHFLLLGGLLHATAGWWSGLSAGAAAHAPATIVVPAAKVAELRGGWLGRNGRLPTAAEEEALLDATIDEEVLCREALARGLDRGDEVVRKRLVELVRFLSEDGSRDEESLYREGLDLGLHKSDLIVRRHLIQTMRLMERQPEQPRPITDADLQQLLDEEADAYRLPAEVTLTHVYLSESRRHGTARQDAERLLARLEAEQVKPEAAPRLGDPFLSSARIAHASERDLQKTFGGGFPGALQGIEPGRWAGPLRSSYGEHLVWIHERVPPRMPPLAAVRTRLLQRLREKRGAERLRARLAELRARYVVRIEEPAPADVQAALARSVPGGAPPPRQDEVTLPQQRPFLGD